MENKYAPIFHIQVNMWTLFSTIQIFHIAIKNVHLKCIQIPHIKENKCTHTILKKVFNRAERTKVYTYFPLYGEQGYS